MPRPVTTPRRPRDGAAAVELAVLLPFLFFIFVISVDFARIYYFSQSMETAARNGAYFASNYVGLYSYQTAEQVAKAEVTNITPEPTVAVRYSSTSAGPFSSTTPIADGYVQVTVTWTFKSIANFPGVPGAKTLTRSCIMQVAPITPTF